MIKTRESMENYLETIYILQQKTGYVSAIIGKIVTQNLTYVFYFYILNIVMVSIDICLYFRNRRLDALASRKA